jgi:hypothetical protein
MPKKILLFGVVAGLVMFVWGAISHTVLPLGTAGFRVLADDTSLLEFAGKEMGEPGIYFYPRFDPSMNDVEMAKWQQKAQTGPSGLIIHRPRGGAGVTPRLLLNELLSNIACGIVAAWLLAQLPATSFARRVGCVVVLGVLAWLAVDFSQWNWYGFPTAYTIAAFVDQAVGFALMGLVLARAFRS